jgi:hypothetical protein
MNAKKEEITGILSSQGYSENRVFF